MIYTKQLSINLFYGNWEAFRYFTTLFSLYLPTRLYDRSWIREYRHTHLPRKYNPCLKRSLFHSNQCMYLIRWDKFRKNMFTPFIESYRGIVNSRFIMLCPKSDCFCLFYLLIVVENSSFEWKWWSVVSKVLSFLPYYRIT